VRLPALYGKGIKKNFIFDMMNFIPSSLPQARLGQLLMIDNSIAPYYMDQNNGFFKCRPLTTDESRVARAYFQKIGFSAVSFTDSRSVFQFYNLDYLWEHIQIALTNGIKKLNIATEPVVVSELYEFVTGSAFTNHLENAVPQYDYRTKHDRLFQGKGGYIFDKDFVLRDVAEFMSKPR
jgi:hypothetical protein